MKEKFIEKNFKSESLNRIRQANKIIEEYEQQGYSLSLRQLYYQFVARDLLPNTQRNYKNLGTLISDARLAGLIDWGAIEDRTRKIRRNNHWSSPAEILTSAARQYTIDKWIGAEHYIEVWVEKDALIDIVTQVTYKKDITAFACKGYVSQSAMYDAAQRFLYWDDKYCILLHLGDHDPSGIDMTRDIEDRLRLFNAKVDVIRIALNRDQIDEYSPPPNPAKITDSRYQEYIKTHGAKSWELDALEPAVLTQIIEGGIEPYFDEAYFMSKCEQERGERRKMEEMITDFYNNEEEGG